MITATLIQIVVFVTYVAYIYRNYGVLTSISASSYELKGQARYTFTMFCWLIGFPIFFQDFGILGFFAAAGLMFTGATTDHGSTSAYTKQVHMVGSIGAIALLFIAIMVDGYWVIPGLFIASCLPVLKSENKIWWIEIFAFIWILFYLIIR